MKIIVPILAGVVLLASCSGKKQVTSIQKQTDQLAQLYKSGVTFYAFGEQPNWNLKWTTEAIKYEGQFEQTFTLENKLGLPTDTTPSNTKYKIPSGNFSILVTNKPCIDSLSKKQFPYRVVGNFGNNDSMLHGCGRNIYDQNINGKWLLKKINNKEIPSQLDIKTIPYIEINGETQKVTGFTGCNKLNGKFLIRGNEITMGEIASTRMACPNVLEVAFVEAFSHVLSYQYNNGTLTLTNNKGETCQFEKPVK
ncbi:MAG: META domain-containing protein [Bacteroidia bacterium]|nr:META domain-containing protein [Bacteroidia bacterium]